MQTNRTDVRPKTQAEIERNYRVTVDMYNEGFTLVEAQLIAEKAEQLLALFNRMVADIPATPEVVKLPFSLREKPLRISVPVAALVNLDFGGAR